MEQLFSFPSPKEWREPDGPVVRALTTAAAQTISSLVFPTTIMCRAPRFFVSVPVVSQPTCSLVLCVVPPLPGGHDQTPCFRVVFSPSALTYLSFAREFFSPSTTVRLSKHPDRNLFSFPPAFSKFPGAKDFGRHFFSIASPRLFDGSLCGTAHRPVAGTV